MTGQTERTRPTENKLPNPLHFVEKLIHGRQNCTPRRLIEPGPSPLQLNALMEAAAAAPDHCELTPWRFIMIPETRRPVLGEVFRAALLERDSEASLLQQMETREKARNAPCVLLAIVDLAPKHKLVPDVERVLSLGCAIQNMLLTARAMGYGSGLSSGKALESASLRRAFGLSEHERATCFVSFGTVSKERPGRSTRPPPTQIMSVFGA